MTNESATEKGNCISNGQLKDIGELKSIRPKLLYKLNDKVKGTRIMEKPIDILHHMWWLRKKETSSKNLMCM